MPTTPVSPGVYASVSDFSQYAQALSTLQLGLVGTAHRGALDTIVDCPNQDAFVSSFGKPDGVYPSFGMLAALQYLRRGSALKYVRVAHPGVQSFVIVKDGSSVDSITFRTIRKENQYNGYLIIIAAGTSTDKKVQVASPSGVVLETYDNISRANMPTVINAASEYIEVVLLTPGSPGAPANGTYYLAEGVNTALEAQVRLRDETKVANENLFVGDGATTAITGTLDQKPIKPGTLTIVSAANTFVDDSAGNILNSVGADVGDIDYQNGTFSITISPAPASLAVVRGFYNTNHQMLLVQSLEKGTYLSDYTVKLDRGSISGFKLQLIDSSSNVVETYDDLTLSTAETAINGVSSYLTVDFISSKNANAPFRNMFEGTLKGTGAITSFPDTLLYGPIKPGSVTVKASTITGVDNGAGLITGTGITSGTIDYTTGVVTLVITVAPLAGVEIEWDYQSLTLPLSETLLANGQNGDYPTEAAVIGANLGVLGYTGLQNFSDAEVVDINTVSVPGDYRASVITAVKTVIESRGDALSIIDHPERTLGTVSERLSLGNGTAKLFTGRLTKGPIKAGSLVIVATIATATVTLTDDGLGRLVGDDAPPTSLGFIDYTTGNFVLIFKAAPDGTPDPTPITASYTSLSRKDIWPVSDLVKWHNASTGFNYDASARPEYFGSAPNSRYMALYGYWVSYFNAYAGAKLDTPSSGHVLASLAYNDSVAYPWYAPAGFSRGLVLEGDGIQYSPRQADRDLMYSGGNVINPIVNFKPEGLTIFGQRTMQRTATRLDRINVLRLVLYARKLVATAARKVLFEPNDPSTWDAFKSLVDPIFADIKSKRGLIEFKIVFDESTTTPAMQDQNRMVGKIYLKPTPAAETIEPEFIITSTGVSFTDL